MVETVIHMAHSLGMSAIVEQVENAAQARISAGFGADTAQGFFFAHPLSRVDSRSFAAGPDIPVFSRTEAQTLLLANGEAVSVDSLLTDSDPGPDASSAATRPQTVPDSGAQSPT